MAVTTVLFWASLVYAVIGSNAAELSILHRPDSLDFTKSSNPLPESSDILKEIFSASLGLSVEENSSWDGLAIKDPFQTPEAVLEIVVDGVSTLGDVANVNGAKYRLEESKYAPNTFNEMKHRIQQRFSNGKNKLVSINLSNLDELSTQSNVFGDIMVPKLQKQSYKYLKPEIEEDLKFMMELNNLKAITDKVKSGALSPADNIVDFYSLHFSALHDVSDLHGANSPQTKEAKKLLGEELQRLTNAMVETYHGSVLVATVTTNLDHTLSKRSVAEGQTRRAGKESYPEDYAAIFNILLWFGVVFVFTLIAIVYALIDMDPGRDSIIYRMTSTRMKKDN